MALKLGCVRSNAIVVLPHSAPREWIHSHRGLASRPVSPFPLPLLSTRVHTWDALHRKQDCQLQHNLLNWGVGVLDALMHCGAAWMRNARTVELNPSKSGCGKFHQIGTEKRTTRKLLSHRKPVHVLTRNKRTRRSEVAHDESLPARSFEMPEESS
jgi:hypothetical protein